MRKLLLVLLGIALAFALWTGARRHSATVPAAPRMLAADFSLTTLDDKPLALRDYRGKIVLLDFWATWCTPCREETPHFVRLQEKYGPLGVQFIGVSMDDDEKPVQQFYREFHMNYPVAIGTPQVGESYGGVLWLPVLFLIDAHGRVAAKYQGAAPLPEVEQRIQRLLAEK